MAKTKIQTRSPDPRGTGLFASTGDADRPRKRAEKRRAKRALGKPRKDEKPAQGLGFQGDRREQQYALREVIQDVTGIRRVCWCGKLAARGKHGVTRVPNVRRIEDRAYWGGLMTCGSVWACPVCAAKIRTRRGQEIAYAANQWLVDGNTVLYAVLTMPHYRADSLKGLLWAQRKAWAAVRADMKKSKRWRHYVKLWEELYGANGWHLHKNALAFVDGEISPEELEAMRARMLLVWNRALERCGYPPASEKHGITVGALTSAEEVSAYVTKLECSAVGMEMTRGDLKKGAGSRTAFQIAADFAKTGDMADLALWKEWETATKGQRWCVWSNGAKAAFGLDEMTDEEVAEEEVGGELVYQLTPDEWHAVKATKGAMAKCLRVTETEGAEGLRRYLSRLRIAHAALKIKIKTRSRT